MMDNGTALHLAHTVEILARKLDDLAEKIENTKYVEMPPSTPVYEAYWVKVKNDYPRCSGCGYYWREQAVGPAGEGHSDIVEAKFCPNCGRRMV